MAHIFPSIEPILQWARIQKVWPDLPKGGVLVDIGCDVPPKLLLKASPYMKKCIGVDIVAEEYSQGNVEVKPMNIGKKIPLPSSSADAVTVLAVLEHLKHPEEVVGEIFRILKPGGKILITVPSPMNKPLLEMFAQVGLVRKEMIDQHENYFTLKRLGSLLKKTGYSEINVGHFQLGLNTYARAIK
jgi:ubiquinone/menaquinone biosynthesis C-methylase UbiE